MRKLLIPVLAVFAASTHLYSQALPAAEKKGNIEVGASVVVANPDYSPGKKAGFNIFADYNFTKHFGAEGKFTQVGGSGSGGVSERTYEAGGRILWGFHPKFLGHRQLTPFANFDVGGGVFNFQNSYQNGTYGMYAGGGGADYNITRSFDVRAAYEYQRWSSFPPRGLQPNLFTIGVVYRIH